MKYRRVDCRWTGCLDPPDESTVWDWLSCVFDEHLTEALQELLHDVHDNEPRWRGRRASGRPLHHTEDGYRQY